MRIPAFRFIPVALFATLIVAVTTAAAQDRAKPEVVIDDAGTVHVPAQDVPMSDFLSPEAKAYVTLHLKQMQDPEILKQDEGVPRFMKPYLERQKVLFAVDRDDRKIGGVHVYVYAPKDGIAEKNKSRILINLHGGGFSGCWPGCAEIESIPISALGRIRVVSVDYREGPDNKFPAASEDVAAVYQDLLKTYKPQDVGIYGCSAGGALTGMSMVWFQRHNLPRPGAIGIFCAGAGGFQRLGDAAYTAMPLGEARLIKSGRPALPRSGYFEGTDPKDPLIAPINSPEALANVPPGS
jgi:acetyl esterase/lipase